MYFRLTVHRSRLTAKRVLGFGFWVLVFLLQLTPYHLPSVFAQTEEGEIRLTTSPLPVTLTTLPGRRVSTELRVRNSGSQPETLRTGLLKFSAQGNDGKPRLMEREAGDDYFDWVSFSPEVFTLAPNEWQTVVMTIDVPPEAAFGYYYAVTFGRAEEEISGERQQTALVGATAILVLLEAQVPNAARDVAVESFGAGAGWYEFLPVDFSLTLRNRGNVHTAPYGTLFITQGNRTVGTIPVNQAKGHILPSSSRAFAISWDDGFPRYVPQEQDGSVVLDDRGHTQQQLTWDFSQVDRLRFGKYTAHLVLAYDDGRGRDVPLEATVEFWVVPWRLILGGLVVAGLVLVGLLTVGRSLWRKVRGGGSRHDDF